jgi:hypothetical protein
VKVDYSRGASTPVQLPKDPSRRVTTQARTVPAARDRRTEEAYRFLDEYDSLHEGREQHHQRRDGPDEERASFHEESDTFPEERTSVHEERDRLREEKSARHRVATW